jgi:hypothetical protein
MSGFLTDGVRDLLTTVGFLLAIVQTWLAIKAARAIKGEPTRPGQFGLRYPTSLKVASVGLLGSLSFIFIGAWLVLRQFSTPNLAAGDNLHQITSAQRITFACVSLWAICYVVASIALENWQERETESPRGARAIVLLTVWSVPVVTLCAVIAGVWAFGRIEGGVIPDAAVAAAEAFAAWTIGWDSWLTLLALSIAMKDEPIR